MKSLTKRTLLFILFISIPSTIYASKSQKETLSQHSKSNPTSLNDAQNVVSKPTTKDIEEGSTKLTQSHKSEMSSHSNKIVIPKDKKSENVETRSEKTNEQSQVSKLNQDIRTPSNKSSDKSSPKLKAVQSNKSNSALKKQSEVHSNANSELASNNNSLRSKPLDTESLQSNLKSSKTDAIEESNSQRSHIEDQSPPQLLAKETSKKSEVNPSHNDEPSHKEESSHHTNEISEHSSKKSVETESNKNDSETSDVTPDHKSKKTHKSLDNGRDSINKSRSKYEKIGDNQEEHICKKNLMSIFSVEGTQLDQAIKATPREKAFCRRNSYTCCSAFNISSIIKYYGAGKKQLRMKFEVIEELLALFRGPKFMEYVQERKELAKCSPLVSDLKIEIRGETFGFFDHGYLRYQLEMAENLLMDTEIYTKKILWFYGDSICSICSPKVQDYFDFSDSSPKLHVHINTCSERIEEREYERNLMLLYDRFISKAMEFIQCTQGVESEENGEDPDEKSDSNGDGEADHFLPLDEEQKEEFLETFDECWKDQRVSNPKCQGFCKKNMRLYEFPIDNLFHNFKVSLKIMYEAMTGGNSIEEFYEEIKESEWKIEDENQPIEFYPASEDWKKYNMDTLEWQYHTSSGHNVFKEIMSKKFTDHEESVAKYAVFIFVVLITLFN
jgi:hypothetical protein